ncbi:kinesin, putative [Trypanosoma brucei gambiense DAL972]|uniref:Kinesin, putative n=2 Tax=Trypanosoma brucei TaxID=5691 RepID=C9ZL08_TRYB9|nr:kinesin, putative [Trypanosoma brucei gambiense DAL972]RHW73900.1 kinesin motor domain containing protein [Trypanosoma brucei equiperdum]CBH10016.1 kinesin, putative [Trypanosoma brucei gambiense DAL972]|eukprot:XP_011772307.1 kinesin, putative [Trypanosoma brucei gambiense DAL972]
MHDSVGTGTRVQVGVRIFPTRQGERSVVHGDPDDNHVVVIDGEGTKGGSALKFDRVFTGSQEEVYDFVGRPMLKEAFEGFNVCLFAYGQTGTGKTYSLFGDLDDKTRCGIAPRFAQAMIEEGQRRMEADNRATIRFSLTMVEVYMEKVRDLLAPRVRGQEPEALEIHEDNQRRVYVKGAGIHPVLSLDRLMELLSIGNANRQKGETKMNETSSRSHAIIQLTISQQHESLETKDVESVAMLVDLAGSERQSKAESTGLAFEEAKKINQSLLMLGRALNSFSDRKGSDGFISLRASKLTRLLSESFGGNSKTWMLATVSPSASNLTETISTLEYAQNASAITNKVRVNEATGSDELKRLRECAVHLEEKLGSLGSERLKKQEELSKLIWERDSLRRSLASSDTQSNTNMNLVRAVNSIRLGNIALRRRVEAATKGCIASLDGRLATQYFKGKSSISAKSIMLGGRRSFTLGLLNDYGFLTEAKLHIQLFPCDPHAYAREDPMILVGESLRFCLNVVGAVGIPESCCAHVFCRFSMLFDNEERYFATRASTDTQTPRWNFVKLFEVPNLTEEIIRSFCERPIFTFEVFAFGME